MPLSMRNRRVKSEEMDNGGNHSDTRRRGTHSGDEFSQDFQPPPSQVQQVSPSKTGVTRMATKAEMAGRSESHRGRTSSAHLDVDSTPSRSNVTLSHHSARGQPLGNKASRASTLPPSTMALYAHQREPFGATDYDTVWNGPVGSFGEADSPPREPSQGSKASSFHQSPRGSPPGGTPPRGYHHYMPYADFSTPYGQERDWNRKRAPHSASSHGPPSHRYSYGPGYYESDNMWNSPPPIEDLPRVESGRTSPLAHGIQMTPEKRPRGHPFRSPLSRNLNRSPLQASPPLGLSSSFGMMGSPDPQIVDGFSPVGPSLVCFDQPNSSSSQPRLSLSRSHSGDLEAPQIRRAALKDSPFAGFMNHDVANPPMPGLHGVARSPLQTVRGSEIRDYHPSDSRQNKVKGLRASPVQPSSEVKPTKLWNERRPSSGGHVPTSHPPRSGMRLEIGQFGAQSSHTQRSLEGINSMMRASNAHRGAARHAYESPYHTPQMYPPPRHGGPYMHPPMYHKGPVPSAQKVPPSSSTKKTSIGTSASMATSKNAQPSTVKSKEKPSPPSKENKANEAVPEKIRCNCRKSKCLKLYCDCFSAQTYCNDGCKCLDCRNTPSNDSVREKAISNARSKNPNAFQQSTGGCRCKRSACLKKYCECFLAGDFCQSSCKCVNCENVAGSQKLIDKRRKMKDSKGAEYATRVAQEVWQSQRVRPNPFSPHGRQPHASPVTHGHMPMHPGIPHHRGFMHPAAFMPPMMGHMGYSPMGVPAVTPLYGQHPHDMHMRGYHPYPSPAERVTKSSDVKSTSSNRKKRPNTSTTPTPTASTPRTPPVRIEFHPSSSRKKRKGNPEEEDCLFHVGEKNPKQPKTAMLNILSFLSNSDIYNAALVSKDWSRVAMDKELWKFE